MRLPRPRRTPERSCGAAATCSRRGLTGPRAVAAVAVGSLALAACGSGGTNQVSNHAAAASGTILYGSLPATGTPVKGGTITIGQITGVTPTWFFPIASGANSVTQNVNLASSLYTPLYFGPNGAVPADNPKMGVAASTPVASNGDRTYTITLKSDWKWSNGRPITAQDVLFGYHLLRAAVDENLSNWGQIVPGQFPQSVTAIKAIGTDRIQIDLNKAYNPGYFLYNQLQDTDWGLYPLPSKEWNVASAGGAHITDWATNEKDATRIYNYLNKQAGTLSTWATNPLWKINSGPFHLSAFNTTNSSYTLTPNPLYGDAQTPHPTATIQFVTYTSSTAELNAIKQGTLDLGGLDPSQLAQVPTLKRDGYTTFGGPGFGWFGGIINFDDTTHDFNHVIAQQYIRGAIYHLVDEPAIIKAVYHGAAVPQYAPVPTAPTSPYAPRAATVPTYAYSPTAAVAALRAHGWDVRPGGSTTCAKPGTAANECGAGIPAGTPISFTWANPPQSYSTTAVGESTFLASAAKKYAGIDINLTTQTYNFLAQNYDDEIPGDAKYKNDWGVNNFGGVYTNYYPTAAGIWTAGGGFNFGDYRNATTNSLVQKSVFGQDPKAVEAEVTQEAASLPAFYFPANDFLLTASRKIGAPATFWLAATQQQIEPEYLYLTK